MAMYQFLAAKRLTASNSEIPTSVMIGATVSGPRYFISRPIRPLSPTATSNSDATMIAPCICNSHTNYMERK